MTHSIFELTQSWATKKNIRCFPFQSIGSTNDQAKEDGFSDPPVTKIYLAKNQTAGRGRNGRTWTAAAPGSQLLATWSLPVLGAPQAITAPLVGLAVYQALSDAFAVKTWSIKPPNDIFLDQKKVAGILVESLQMGHEHRLIIGIGLNVWDHPTSVDVAGHVSHGLPVTAEMFHGFLDRLHDELLYVARSCLAPNMTDSQRDRLLVAIQACPLLPLKPVVISPFGDIVNPEQTISWRNL